MLKLKITSSLEKFFPGHDRNNVPTLSPYPILAGEVFSLHAVFWDEESFLKNRVKVSVTCDAPNCEVRLYRVDSVPVRVAAFPGWVDDDYMTTSPGIYPDVMVKIDEDTPLFAPNDGMNMLRAEVWSNSDTPFGEYTVTLTLRTIDESSPFEEVSESVTFEVLRQSLPPQKTTVMQWLHADCIAERYGIGALSDKHFEYVEKAVRLAVENGINALYTPVFTPPLDTEVGGERLTVQLVDVKRECGKWSFSYDNLDRWCDMALRCGVEYFEISHLFTQWGARHAPKIMADVDGKLNRVFGWDTDAAGEEYVNFLREFLADLLRHMKSRGLDKRCIFHISDEPSEENFESYRAASESVRDILSDYIVADAVSNVEYYKSGAIRHPIAGCDHAKDFLPYIPDGLWVYYCCSQSTRVSNRYIAMPLSRVRIMGLQMWKAKASGFLHWGYNFYNSQYSRYPVDPYTCTDGEYFAPAGDAFSVYPGEDGEAVPSLRLRAFHEALSDIRALEAAEAVLGREAVLAAIEEDISSPLEFDSYPKGAEYILNVRRKLGRMLKTEATKAESKA